VATSSPGEAYHALDRACSGGEADACRALLESVEAEPNRNLDWMQRRHAVAARLCGLGDCARRYEFTVGDGTEEAESAWRTLCAGNGERVLRREEAPRLASGGFGQPDVKRCDYLRAFAVWANGERNQCLSGGDVRHCTGWTDALIAADPPRARLVGFEEERTRRRMPDPSSFETSWAARNDDVVAFDDPSPQRRERRVLCGPESQRFWQEFLLAEQLHRLPRSGECLPGFVPCKRRSEVPTTRGRLELLLTSTSRGGGVIDPTASTYLRSLQPDLETCYSVVRQPTGKVETPVDLFLDGTGTVRIVYLGQGTATRDSTGCAIAVLNSLRPLPHLPLARLSGRLTYDESPDARRESSRP